MLAPVWDDVGEWLEGRPLRVYLTGTLEVETARGWLDLRPLPGRQGRRAFVYLARKRSSPVARDALADAVWGEALPPAWDRALSAVVSKIRTLFATSEEPLTVNSGAGWYQLALPPGTWVDMEAATNAIDAAEGALRAGALNRAWGDALVAAAIGRRPFLPGDEGDWIERERTALRAVATRAVECLSELALETGEGTLAVRYAEEAIELEPYRESSYQRLMRAHVAMGNRAEALRVYLHWRQVLNEELGTDPAPETEALYLTLL